MDECEWPLSSVWGESILPKPRRSGRPAAHFTREEDRFVLMGLSSTLRVLTVVHGYRENDEVFG